MDDLLCLTIILYCHRECAVCLGAGMRAHAVRDLLLHHDGNAVCFDAVLQQLHDDRCGDIVRQIADDAHMRIRHAGGFRLCLFSLDQGY